MLNVKRGSSTHTDSYKAALEVVEEINQNNPQIVLFFVSSIYNFQTVHDVFRNHFKNTIVAGCTSQGEITTQLGYGEHSLSALSISSDDLQIAPVLCKNVSKQSMLYKNTIVKAMQSIDLNPSDPRLSKKGFALALIDGLTASEEKVMMMMDYLLKGNSFNLIGGSAGTLDEVGSSYISLNDEIVSDAALLIFIRTNKPFMIYKENIYEPTGDTYLVTHANLRNRTIYEINNRPATEVFAQALNTSPNMLDTNLFASNPIGRLNNNELFIASPFAVQKDGSIQFYSQISNGTPIHFMRKMDASLVAKQTAKQISSTLTRPKLILGFNCILRHLQFKNEKSSKQLFDILDHVAPFCGFTTLGEQYGTEHINQTLTLLALGE